MSIRVAVASEDGKTVHQHFGQATQFVICDLDGPTIRVIERRPNRPSCGGVVDGEPGHNDDLIQQTIDLIADCRAVVVARIGLGAQKRLEAQGIDAFMIPDFIDRALRRLSASGLLEQPPGGSGGGRRWLPE